jgi:hypothetical protein
VVDAERYDAAVLSAETLVEDTLRTASFCGIVLAKSKAWKLSMYAFLSQA